MTSADYREGKDIAELREEMQMLVEQGHRGFKAAVGGRRSATGDPLEIVRPRACGLR